MILIALGSNRKGPWGSPRATLRRALRQLDRDGLRLVAASRLIVSAPFGRTDQPAFVNGVARIATRLAPADLMERLHAIEKEAGRQRRLRWGPRTLDLDLIDYNGQVSDGASLLRLPHPGIAERIFVLKPIAEIAPRWRHPVSRRTAADLLRRLDPSGEGGEI